MRPPPEDDDDDDDGIEDSDETSDQEAGETRDADRDDLDFDQVGAQDPNANVIPDSLPTPSRVVSMARLGSLATPDR